MRSVFDSRVLTMMALLSGGLLLPLGLGCTRALIAPVDAGDSDASQTGTGGGSIETGGSSGSGGGTGGGPVATGGGTGTGGVVGTGGRVGTGGVVGTGGATATATGGRVGTGGVVGTGGRVGSGGVVGTGGRVGTGGVVAGTGGAGTGGVAGAGGAGGSIGGTGGATPVDGGAGAPGDAAGEAPAPIPVSPTVAGVLVVTELMHDTDVVADDFGEWFEIYNPSDTVTYDLNGCELRDTSNVHVINRALLVPPRAFRTLALFSVADGLMGGGFVPDYTYAAVKFDNDASDFISVICGGTIIDRFLYSNADAATSGASFSVDPTHYRADQNDVPGNYCQALQTYREATTTGGAVIRDHGTPGAPNPACQ